MCEPLPQGIPPDRITILTPYLGQLALLRRAVAAAHIQVRTGSCLPQPPSLPAAGSCDPLAPPPQPPWPPPAFCAPCLQVLLTDKDALDLQDLEDSEQEEEARDGSETGSSSSASAGSWLAGRRPASASGTPGPFSGTRVVALEQAVTLATIDNYQASGWLESSWPAAAVR